MTESRRSLTTRGANLPGGVDHRDEAADLLRHVFGQELHAIPMAVTQGQSERDKAFALFGHHVPPYVLLRRYPTRDHKQAFRAFTALNALCQVHYPVPKTYYLGWHHRADELVLLVEHVIGSTEAGQPVPFFVRIAAHFALTLAYLHQINWNLLPDLPVMSLRYMVRELTAHIEHLDNWQLHQALDWVRARYPHVEEQPRTVVHGDYTLRNVIAHGPQIVRVMGWERAAIADPRLDIGMTSAVLGSYGVPFADQFLDAYQLVTGPIADHDFWAVAGALRLLVRLGARLSTLRSPDYEQSAHDLAPTWNALLSFVESRTGLDLV
jgi:aminoglycoside phosphotransferase (APT) family kinase protein